jgi:hypothetical protein
LRLKQVAQGRFHELGHGSPLARCFSLELRHDRVVDLQGGLHMENHIIWMDVCQGKAGARRANAPRSRMLQKSDSGAAWLS